MKSKLAIATLALYLAGCSTPAQQPEETRSMTETTKTLPVLSYTVRKGDSIQKLFHEELSQTRDMGRKVGVTHEDEFLVSGGFAGTSNERIHYRFNLNELLNGVNATEKFNFYSELRQGETINFIDFSRDGTIAGREAEKVGTLTLYGEAYRDGKLSHKSASYNGKIIFQQ